MDNRPRGREKNVTGSANVGRSGQGLGTGPSGKKYSGNTGHSSGNHSGGNGSMGRLVTRGGGASILVVIIMVIVNMLGGGSGNGGNGGTPNPNPGGNNNPAPIIGTPTTGQYGSDTSYNQIDQTVATGSRAKRTNLKGGGSDVITIMVYMCGTDLESKSGMASADIQEMANASLSDKINLIIFTGGCNKWKLSGIRNDVNQIYKIENGKLRLLESNMGTKAMTDPANLSSFISYCAKQFPANRYELIMWDHGGGSVSGYGYDETKKNSGSMTLAGINSALKAGGVTFDFIGFDACLMATAETALMLDSYADYLIASEETEPGIGWYYTDWLTALGKNSSMPTVEIGKRIIDDFVGTCAKRVSGQKATLSIIDLAEFANTVPDKLSAFSKSISSLLTAKEYKKVSDARSNTREFATSSKIDQIDLVDLAQNMGTNEGKELAKVLKAAVKYNKTSTNIADAYGVSIFFPYQKTSYVDRAVNTYNMIGMDDDYAKCIRQFASLETSGQIAAGGSATASPINSLFNLGASGGNSGNPDIIGQLLSGFLGGRSLNELDRNNTDYMQEQALSKEETIQYLAATYFDVQYLDWKKKGDQYIISMPESQWGMVKLVDKRMFLDDGEGYIDLGMDNVYDFTSDGDLIADTEKTWLAINGHVVAYYHTDTIERSKEVYAIHGYVPALLNGQPVKINITFDNTNPKGYISGVTLDYKDKETDTVAKSDISLVEGDRIDFVCDYYTYDQKFVDSFTLGEPMIVSDKLEISDVILENGKEKIMYCFTDLYNQEYYTKSIQ